MALCQAQFHNTKYTIWHTFLVLIIEFIEYKAEKSCDSNFDGGDEIELGWNKHFIDDETAVVEYGLTNATRSIEDEKEDAFIKGDLVRFKSGDIEVRTYVSLRDEKEVKSLKLRKKFYFRNILKIPHGKDQDDSLLCSICYFMWYATTEKSRQM